MHGRGYDGGCGSCRSRGSSRRSGAARRRRAGARRMARHSPRPHGADPGPGREDRGRGPVEPLAADRRCRVRRNLVGTGLLRSRDRHRALSASRRNDGAARPRLRAGRLGRGQGRAARRAVDAGRAGRDDRSARLPGGSRQDPGVRVARSPAGTTGAHAVFDTRQAHAHRPAGRVRVRQLDSAAEPYARIHHGRGTARGAHRRDLRQ